MGFIVSPRATNEELAVISRLAGLLNKSRVASSACYHTGKAAAACRQMGITPVYRYDSLESCDTIIVAGADLLINNHLLANKVREAVKLKGASVIVLDPLPASLARIANVHLQVIPGRDELIFNALSCRLLKEGKYDKEAEKCDGFSDLRDTLAANEAAPGLARQRRRGGGPGKGLRSHPGYRPDRRYFRLRHHAL